jgi:long-chain acyl-CoA synthetase
MLKPTIFGSFPLFFNKIHRSVLNKMSETSAFAQSIFNSALSTKIANLNAEHKFSHMIYDPLLFKDIKNVLGG